MRAAMLAAALIANDPDPDQWRQPGTSVCEHVNKNGWTHTEVRLSECEATVQALRGEKFACEKALSEYRPAKPFCPACGRRCDACPDIAAHGWAPHVVMCRDSTLRGPDLGMCVTLP